MKRRERFVPGIYNYCDRWCEKCAFTNCCRVCADEQRARRRRKPSDGNELDWSLKVVSRSFEKLSRMLARWEKREGLDLEQMAREGAEIEARRPRHPRASVSRSAREYMDCCDDFLKKLRELCERTGKELAERAGYMDVKADLRRLRRVVKAVEVLTWDFRLIWVKIQRALGGLAELPEETDPEIRALDEHEVNGSAAVARRSLVRSQAALVTVYEWDESIKDEALELLVKAQRVLRSLDRKFPGAAGFQWPPPEATGQARAIKARRENA